MQYCIDDALLCSPGQTMACGPGNVVTRMTVGAVRRGFSFRSVHAAMKAARDGDQIILRKGIHNGLG